MLDTEPLSTFPPPVHQRWKGKYVLIAVGFFLTLCCALLLIFPPLFVKQAELRLYDLMLAGRAVPPKSDALVMVGIDEESLEFYGQWPWPRYRLARLVERLWEEGATVVALDFLMAEPDRTSPDIILAERHRDLGSDLSPSVRLAPRDINSEYLAKALSAGKSIVGCYFDFSRSVKAKTGGTPAIPAGMVVVNGPGVNSVWPAPMGVIRDVPMLTAAAQAEGFINARHDLDGVLRRVPLLIQYDGSYYPSLALGAILLASPERSLRISNDLAETVLVWGNRRVPLDQGGNLLLDFRRDGKRFPYLSAKSILEGHSTAGALRGKIVVVGSWAKALGDPHQVPFGQPLHGLEVHATIIDNILSGTFVSRPGWARGAELFAVLLFGGVATWFFSRPGFVLSLMTIGVGTFGVFWGGRELLHFGGIHISPLLPMATTVIVLTVLSLLKYEIESRLARQLNRDLIAARYSMNEEENRRIRSEEALQKSEENYRELVEQSNSIILRVTPSGVITFINEYAETFFGYSRHEIVGRSMVGTIESDSGEDGRSLVSLIKSLPASPEELLSHEKEYIRKDGERVWVSWSNKPVYSENGDLLELLCVGQDISVRRILEQQVLQQQKLESIGLLAGGIAHDFNNMLVPIFGYAEMIKMNTAPDNAMYHQISKIMEAAGKASDLVKQLLSFSRKQMLATDQLDINQVISSFAEIMRRTIRENIEIRLQLCNEACPVMADQTNLEQVLLNLAVNAQDAISATGIITIETGHVLIDDEYCRLHPGIKPGKFIMVAFSDSGCGMDDATLAHVFEPFFTTKATGRGTGLGLSTVYGIVKQHEGFITIHSAPGKGSIFKFYLPHRISAGKVTTSGPLSAAVSGQRKTVILLVEDNKMVIDMVREILESHGNIILAAETPEQALEIARTESERIKLLISDVIMPQMDGPELYERLLEIIPDLRVLFMSGYASNLLVHKGCLEERAHFIAKPFTAQSLIAKIEEVLEVPANQ